MKKLININKISRLLLFLFGFFVSVIFPCEVKAADSFSLKVYPPVSYLSVKPGAAITQQIELVNNGQFTLQVTPQIVDFHSDNKDGAVILEQKATNNYINIEGEADNWGEFFTLRPTEKKQINLLISVPSSAKQEEIHASILFQAEQQIYEGQEKAGQSLISGIVASNVILAISTDGEDRGELTIENFSLPRFVDSFMGISFSAKVKNIGFNAKPVEGYFKISHWPETETEIYQLYPDMVLADSQRVVRAMSEEDLDELELLEKNKDVLIANGKDFDLEKEKMIQEKLQSKMFYKKAFLLGTYDFELKVGDDILQKRVIALPFSLLAILLLFPVLYLFLKFLLKKTDQKEKEKIES
jgi:hypothetical protein